MSSFNLYGEFYTSAQNLLQVIQIEEDYLQNSRLRKLDSLFEKKKQLLKANEVLTAQILDANIWNTLEKAEQKNVNRVLKSIVLAMKKNIDLLDISKRGNKKLLDLSFRKIKSKPIAYNAFGKIFETRYAPSMGVQHMV